jgi:hypothetical protein
MKKLILICALLVAGCHSGTTSTPAPTPTGDAFFAQVTEVIATLPDDADAATIDALVATKPEDSEPIAL